jgi:hypothetical protein
MAPNVPASIALYEKADGLKEKGRYAGAAEKLGCAVAAAAQELAGAEDCLAVALLRAVQAEALFCHSFAPMLPAAEQLEALQTVVSVLLPQCVATLTRRKAAGTLLPGSCRPAEVAWWRVTSERMLLKEGKPAKMARIGALGFAPMLGFDAYMYAAKVSLDVLTLAGPRELQLSRAAFVASALDLIAQPRDAPPCYDLNNGNTAFLHSNIEYMLAQYAHRMFRQGRIHFDLDSEAASLLADAWRRVERSGAGVLNVLEDHLDPETSIQAFSAGAAAEGAVRGLRGCELAGCASKEVHVSQFKRCAACQQAFYCCREHQLADWPAHKAACKAARKAAASSSK